MPLPKPKLETIMLPGRRQLHVVRDDLIPGGTKQRALQRVLAKLGPGEYVYAGPVTGYAGLALAHACLALGNERYRATVFQAMRVQEHPRTTAMRSLNVNVIEVKMGRLSNVKAKARRYCDHTGAVLLPWGFDHPLFLKALTDIARSLPVIPREVWTVAGSGVLSRALQSAWPTARFYAVNISQHKVNAGFATVIDAPELFEADAQIPPPFPSCSNYDAKAWRFILERARSGALFWNVAS